VPPPKIDLTKVDVTNYEDFLFEIDDYTIVNKKTNKLKSIEIEVKIVEQMADNKLKESVDYICSINIEDIYTLDLPILYYKIPDEAIVIDYYDDDNKDELKDSKTISKVDAQKSVKKNLPLWLQKDFTYESNERYNSLSKRQPLSFEIHKSGEKNENNDEKNPRLPVQFFWVRESDVVKMNKNTGCQNFEEILNEFMKEPEKVFEKKVAKQTRDCASSPIPLPENPIQMYKTSRLKSIEKSKVTFKSDHIFKSNENEQTFESDSAKEQDKTNDQEDYQLEIDKLNLKILQLESELNQHIAFNQMNNKANFNNRGQINNNKNLRLKNLHQNSLKEVEEQKLKIKQQRLKSKLASNWGKDLPEDVTNEIISFSKI
jgi:hypothetical protein